MTHSLEEHMLTVVQTSNRLTLSLISVARSVSDVVPGKSQADIDARRPIRIQRSSASQVEL